MPGTTFDARPDQFLLPNGSDYFTTSACSAGSTNDITQLRPRSAGSERSEPSASRLMFTRWARRHHHQHHSQSRRDRQEAQKPNGPGRGSGERKASSRGNPRRSGRSRSNSIQKRQSEAATVPRMTREEFEALPLAIQRKYFSTLERLRFAQESGLVDGISQHYDDITISRRRKPRQDRCVSEHSAGRTRRESVLRSHFSTSDSSLSYAGLQDAAQETGYSREKQIALARQLRASVILDAADEAVYKLNQQTGRKNPSTTVDTTTPPPSPRRHNMDSIDGPRKHPDQQDDGHVPQSFFDSFRWLDEEEDLDLRFFLDDYHSDLREGVARPTKQQRPSFRRHLSISKLPFGRTSASSSRPATNDATTPTSPIRSPATSVSNSFNHTRRKSRALSLITPKHVPQPSITAFDPAAAHYQDPEARLKLRVYLASPQKFDEAVEFGFPSADALTAASPLGGDGAGLPRRQSKLKLVDSPPNMRTFLADGDDEDGDNLSLSSDQLSLADPDSPKTPEDSGRKAGNLRHARFASADALYGRGFGAKGTEGGGYAQAPASSREMTLRMTLTRPDLRAHEDEIYGWQHRSVYQQHSRRPTALASPAAEVADGAFPGNWLQQGSLEKLPAMDHWNATAAATDRGVIKRIWNRVRRG
ncbi:hypothetical protein VTK56DRAFT_315 [Thermocarpiscus australiensis]